MMNKPSIRVTVTGAAGRVAYSMLFRIACGDMLGADQPVQIVLFDLPRAMTAMQGVLMELKDCAFPLLTSVIATDDPAQAFNDTQIALLVSARPRTVGAERLEVLADNAKIFAAQGAFIGRYANANCKVLVVGNPCNTNAYVAIQAAQKFGRIPARNFAALLRLDHNRGLAQLALETGQPTIALKRLVAWGNHSPLVYIDDRFVMLHGKKLTDVGNERSGHPEALTATVDERGAAVLQIRGQFAEASAASAVIDQMRDWWFGTQDEWTTMGVQSDGSYGVPEGLVFGFPVTIGNGDYRIVPGLDINEFARNMINNNVRELLEELAIVKPLLPELFA
jgi:malate dehydrogenase